MTFIKLTPHMDLQMSKEISGELTGNQIPINQLKDPQIGFSYTDSSTVPCMVNVNQILRVYTGKVFTRRSTTLPEQIRNPDVQFYDSIEYSRDELLHTIIELTNGDRFSVIELPEYVSFLIAGRGPRNWPTNVSRYHTLPMSRMQADEESIPEMDELPVSQNYIG